MECNNKRKRNYKLTKMPYPLWWRGPVYVLERPNPRTWGKGGDERLGNVKREPNQPICFFIPIVSVHIVGAT